MENQQKDDNKRAKKKLHYRKILMLYPPQKTTEISKENWDFHVISLWLYHDAAHLLESGVSLGIS